MSIWIQRITSLERFWPAGLTSQFPNPSGEVEGHDETQKLETVEANTVSNHSGSRRAFGGCSTIICSPARGHRVLLPVSSS